MFENIEGVVTIGGDLYVKTPVTLKTLLQELRDTGYEVDDLRVSEHRKERGTTVETMEKGGWSLWFAHIDVKRGKCKSCGGLISMRGIQVHGHTCELCGAVTFLRITDGSKIRFSFKDEEHSMVDISMKAKRWDTESGYLYLYPEVLDDPWLRGEQAKCYFEKNSDKWEKVFENGQELVRVRYPEPYDYATTAIEVSDIYGHYWNHRIVRVWEGKEYGDYGDFPVRESMSIFETWHWAPLNSSPTLHRKVLGAIHDGDDKGWYHQDGRPWFNYRSFSEMGKFIRHFTTLDADLWDKQSLRFRLDGPGGIDDVANFCHEGAQGENHPNFGNMIAGVASIMEGKKLSNAEVTAVADAMRDPRESGILSKIFGRR